MAPGSNAAPGQKYPLEVTPRSASLCPGMLLGPIGDAIDASVNENSSAFEMRFVGELKGVVVVE